jgi:hypothetical protein
LIGWFIKEIGFNMVGWLCDEIGDDIVNKMDALGF